MKTKSYGKLPCKFCGKMISTNGLGYNSHMRTHVREGIARPTLDVTGLCAYEPAAHPPGGQRDER